jgi:hypothetical protein
MRGMQPWKLILIGFVLVLFGFVAPFLMVIKIVPSSFVLNFLSYGASVVGLFLGLIGAALYVRTHRD